MPSVKLIHHPEVLRKALDAARRRGKGVGLVPTMGALHPGHVALVRRALRECGVAAVSIFVNPTQFGPAEDFAKYPRTFKADLRALAGLGDVIVFAPSAQAMYPAGDATRVRLSGPLVEVLEGAARPTHFEGVATVVAKLFGLAGPCRAYFGEKDFQQLLVVRRMARDLALPVTVVPCPIVRDTDGLAKSSRNAYLDAADRAWAPRLKRALDLAASLARQGKTPAAACRRARAFLEQDGRFKADYLVIVDAETLQRPRLGRARRALAAARIGRTRLIDNVKV